MNVITDLGIVQSVLASNWSIQCIMTATQVARKSSSPKVTNIICRCLLLVRMVVGNAFLWCSDVHLIVLILRDTLLDTCQHPGSSAESSPLEAEGNDKKNIRNGVVHESKGEGGGGILPGDGSKDGGDDSTLETIVHESLGTIRDAKDVLALTRSDVHARDGSYEEETGNDGELTSNHESRKIFTIALEEYITSLASEERSSTFIGGDLGNGKEGNLHSLQRTNDGHEEEEEKDGDWRSDAGVLDRNHGLSLE